MFRAPDGSVVWWSVTAELHSAEQPLGQWFRAYMPTTAKVFSSFRATVSQQCIETPPGIPGGTAGAAFDYLVRYQLGAADAGEIGLYGATYCPGQGWSEVALGLTSELSYFATRCKKGELDEGCSEEVLRGCWAMALFTELARGVNFERSALAALGRTPTRAALLGLMPAEAVGDAKLLHDSFSMTLSPFIPSREGQLVAGPAFSNRLPGDADMIKGTTLIEIKAMVHRRKRDGTPRYGLDARMIYQVLAYALLGQTTYAIDEIATFNARYSHLYSWQLNELLSELSDPGMDAVTLAAELDLFLENPLHPRVPEAAREAARRILDS